MNIVTPEIARVNVNVEFVAPAAMSWWADFQLGRELHAADEPITRCTSDEQRRGWRVAYRREAGAHCGIIAPDGLPINMISGEVWG